MSDLNSYGPPPPYKNSRSATRVANREYISMAFLQNYTTHALTVLGHVLMMHCKIIVPGLDMVRISCKLYISKKARKKIGIIIILIRNSCNLYFDTELHGILPWADINACHRNRNIFLHRQERILQCVNAFGLL